MTHRFVPKAALELRTTIRNYESQRPGLGRSFSLEVKAIVAHVLSFPEACQDVGDGVRRCRLKQFPFGLFHSIEGDEVVIHAVSHLHRDPDHWRNRL